MARPHARALRPGKGDLESVLAPLDGHKRRMAAPTVAADGAVEPALATGEVKLSPSTMTPQQILEELQTVNVGMNGTPAYSGLSIMADVSAGAGEDAGNE